MHERKMYCYEVPVDDQEHVFSLSHSPVAVAVIQTGLLAFSVEFWAEHTEDAPEVKRAFRVFGTGQPLPEGARWIGTCPRTVSSFGTSGGLVWHLYEV